MPTEKPSTGTLSQTLLRNTGRHKVPLVTKTRGEKWHLRALMVDFNGNLPQIRITGVGSLS